MEDLTPRRRENHSLFFIEIPIPVKKTALVASDRISSLLLHSQLLLSPLKLKSLKSIFTRIFKFSTFEKYLFTLQTSADEGSWAKLLRLFLNFLFFKGAGTFQVIFFKLIFLTLCFDSVQVSEIDASIDLKLLNAGNFTDAFWLSVYFPFLLPPVCPPAQEELIQIVIFTKENIYYLY